MDLKTAVRFKIHDLVHDLVHDLAISVAQVEYSTVNNFRPSSAFEKVRIVSISGDDFSGEEAQVPKFMLQSSKLRTIVMLSDVQISVAQVEYSTVNNFRPSSAFEKVRIVSISGGDFSGEEAQVPKFMLQSSKLRTIVMLSDVQMKRYFVKTCILRCKCIRVLNLSGSPLEELPSSIGSLCHLRFLDLSCNGKIKRLPSSIRKLLNLESLNLSECPLLVEMPKEIWNLINLRNLEITTQQMYLPKGIRSLTLLQSLHFEGCVILHSLGEEIQFLTNLRKFWVTSCQNLEFLPPNMKHLTTLDTLFIRECGKLKLMSSVEGPQGLRSIGIAYSDLDALPRWHDSIETLQSLGLGQCDNLTVLPGLENFKFLEQLVIKDCFKLLALPQGLHRLTELKELKIIGCRELSKSCKRQLKGEDWSKMARHANITLDSDVDTDDEEDAEDDEGAFDDERPTMGCAGGAAAQGLRVLCTYYW
ncbi:hypothetical protein ACLB2K_037559 [Fragaria x ananassa]